MGESHTMKKSGLLVFFFVGLLFACQPAKISVVTKPTVVAHETLTTLSNIPATTPTAISITSSSRSKPTTTPNVIALPAITQKTEPHPLALSESNAGTEMKRVNVLGTGTLQDIKFSPDGKYLAAATGRGVYLYDGKTFEQLSFIDVNDSVSAIAISPDGMTLAVAVDGKVSLWNVISGKKQLDLDDEIVSIWTLAYGEGGYVAASGTDCRGCGSPEQVMILWNVKTGHKIYSEHDIWYATESLAFTSDGEKLAFGGTAGLTIIESETGKVIDVFHSGSGVISEAVDAPLNFIFGNDDAWLFVTSSESIGNQILEISTQQRQIFSFCDIYLIRANNIGACPLTGEVIFFDLSNGNKISDVKVPGLLGWGSLATLSPDGEILVYKIEDTLHIIHSKTGSEVKTLFFNTLNDIQTGIVSLDGETKYIVAVKSQPGQINLLDLETGDNLQTLNLSNNTIKAFAFRPDYEILAFVDENNLMSLWDLQAHKKIYETTLSEDTHGPITFSPDGLSILLTSSPDDYILEFVLSTGKFLNYGKNYFAYDYANPFTNNNYHFNELGNLVMLRYKDNFPIFEDVKTTQVILIPYKTLGDFEYITSFAISFDEKFLAIGNAKDIFIWDFGNQKLLSTLSGHEIRTGDGWIGKIRSLVFSPQSNLLVSVGWDGTTRLWNIRTGQELRRLNVCCNATFTPDGKFLITIGDGVIRIWGIPNQ